MRFNTAATCLAVTCLAVCIGENASLVVAAEGSDHHGHMADDHAWMDESDASIVAYCLRPCVGVGAGASITDVDPCGDGMGQSGFCTPISGLEDPTAFGYAGADGDGAAVPDAFLGCSHAVCAASCGDMAAPEDGVLPTATVAEDGTVCFPRTAMMDGMYMSKDDAELSAVARGCSGSHAMGEMVMVGSTHPACASSYSKEGVLLGTFPEVGSSEDDFMHNGGHHADDGHHGDDHHHKDDLHAEDDLTSSASFQYANNVTLNIVLASTASLLALVMR